VVEALAAGAAALWSLLVALVAGVVLVALGAVALWEVALWSVVAGAADAEAAGAVAAAEEPTVVEGVWLVTGSVVVAVGFAGAAAEDCAL
jgi:hypothetical protein